ncbi:Outer membrane receptor proteins, mostly Fe transport [Arsukibacterium tuosuense]|uniref:Outer membrane receptor proteins, mostly Fe transport n=1 Tax=Arsukibacterium tuosuense TaxID=1323745 RepID=A0A285J9D0_9GAMM|nr:TonB-dependent receptor [Arsukibacterium tuosuense]SNY56848.1 Outer membrane receptor proteins, mostly Fe transport [Arsukibacterium tuosuense]
MRFSPSLVTSAVFAALAATNFAYADNSQTDAAIERITVQGDLRQQSAGQLAGSLSVVTEQDLQRQSVQHLDQLLNQFANVNFSAGASRGRYVQVRGIGERSEFVDTINPSVGILIDGIDYSGLGISGISDIAQFEVFRGPEATRFGANALAGMLNLTTKGPTDSAEGKASLTVANYDSYQLAGQFSNAITSKWGYSLSLEQQRSDGFIENRFLDRDDTNNIDELTGRLKLAYQPTDTLKLQLVSHFVDQDNGYDAFSLDRDRTTLSDQPGQDKLRSKALALQADYTGLTFARLQGQLSWLDAAADYGFDEDWSYVGLHPDEYSTTDRYLRDREQLTLDYRLVSTDAGRLGESDWVLGIYAASKEFDLTRQFWNWDLWQADSFASALSRSNLALYTELSTPLTEKLTLVSGLRLERYEDEYADSSANRIDNSDTMWGAKLSLNFQPNPQALIYLLASRGYKAGGVNGDALAKAADDSLNELLTKASFAPETLYNAEFGVKGTALDQSLVTRVAAFYMWREDMQVKGWLNPDSGPQFAGFIDNAGSGRNYGVEVESRLQVNPQLALMISASWLKTKLGNYVTIDGDDFSGREQAQAPRFGYNLAADWYLSDALIFNVGLQGKDSYYYSDGHNQRSSRYELLNLRLSYQLQQWQLAVWSRNALDQDVGVRGFYFGNDPRDGYEPHLYEQFAEPRRIGLSASYQF